MFRRHLLSLGAWGFAAHGGVCLDTPGEGASGGAAPAASAPAAAAAADPGTADPAGAAAADPGAGDDPAAAGGAGDEGDEDDFSDVAEHLPEPQLRTRLRRTQRLAQRVRPIADRFRDPRTGQYMPAEQVDGIISRAREFEPIDAVLRASPRAVQVLLEEQQRIARGGAPAGDPADDQPQPFDEAAWPFEQESAEGKALLQLARQNHDLQQNYKTLQRQLTGMTQETQNDRVSRLNTEWKTATLAAAADVDEAYRPMFIRNVNRAFQLLKAQGTLTKANAKTVIDEELAEVRAARRSTTRSTTTRQSAAAAGNTTLPRVPRPGAVQPAAAGATNERQTMKHASAGFLGKYRG